jgi:penicillin-binding protein 1A
LIKNLILTRERTITRKLKEIVLALQLNDYLENKIKQQYPNLSPEQVKQKVKEKILEMYLNYIFLGNNSYGVEAAANTYFHKSANELSVLESAILAAIPKSPLKYDPLTHRENNLGKLEVFSAT